MHAVKTKRRFFLLTTFAAFLFAANFAAAASPAISGYVEDEDPSICYYSSATGYTPSGSVYVGSYDSGTSSWTAGHWVTADSSGNVADGNFSMDCADSENQCLYGYDDSTGLVSNCVTVRSNCIE